MLECAMKLKRIVLSVACVIVVECSLRLTHRGKSAVDLAECSAKTVPLNGPINWASGQKNP